MATTKKSTGAKSTGAKSSGAKSRKKKGGADKLIAEANKKLVAKQTAKPTAKPKKASPKKKSPAVEIDTTKGAKSLFYEYGEKFGVFVYRCKVYAKIRHLNYEGDVFEGEAMDIKGNLYRFIKNGNEYIMRD